MRKPLAFVLVITALAGSVRSFAQGDTDCLTTLSHAESEFAAGRFYGVPELLSECLKSNRFSNEEKVRVYMLLTQVYLLTDNPTAADETYLKLLNANPEFVPSDLDPIEIIYLSKKFTSTPIFTPHFKGGVNISSQSVIYARNVSSTPDSTKIRRTPMAGWSVGGGVEWNITDNLGLGVEGYFSQKTFRTNIDNLFRHDDEQTIERQLWVDIPVYLRYQQSKGTFRPFAYAGGSLNLLLSSKIEESYNDRTAANGTESDKVTPVTGQARSITYKRNLFNRSLVFGGGTKIKIGKDFLVIDVRYMPGLSNVANIKNANYSGRDRSGLDPSMTTYASMSDIFRVNNFSLSFGYVRPIYNPRKARRVNTRSVSRKLIRNQKNDKDEK